MPLISNFLAIIGLLVAFTVGVAPSSARAEQRIALVLGNAAYETGALKTTANDAGLIAQTLEAAGFEVIGARDLDNEALRRAFRDFVDKAAALGPDGVAVLYLGGYGLQCRAFIGGIHSLTRFVGIYWQQPLLPFSDEAARGLLHCGISMPAAAAPPSSVMKWRRLIQSPLRRARGA